MSRAASLKALLGNLRFIIEWKTWAVLVVFALGVAVSAAWCLADGQVSERRPTAAPEAQAHVEARQFAGPSWRET